MGMFFLIRELDKMCHTETPWKCWLFGSIWFTISFCGPNKRYEQTNQQKTFWQTHTHRTKMLIAFLTCRKIHRNSELKMAEGPPNPNTTRRLPLWFNSSNCMHNRTRNGLHFTVQARPSSDREVTKPDPSPTASRYICPCPTQLK